ncbi:MAG: YwiC-like family protein [Anaerolineales bacterium]|nr:MAG: YwiC-like family protein [Anaerolineales bacterium]
MTEIAISRRRLFRKSLVIPTEHGSWSWLLVPFFVGTAVATQVATQGHPFLLPVSLALVGGLCAFLMRQPAAAWLRIRRGRASRADEPLAAGWALGLGAVAGLCLAGLLMLGRAALLWLLIPFAGVLLLYLVATRSGRSVMRSLWTELIGAIGLALMAPAAVVAATGTLHSLGWALWGLMGIQNALGVLYVRLRLADTRQRPTNRNIALWGHLVGLSTVILAGLLGWVPVLAALPFAGVLLRAIWAVRQPRPVTDVRRFGFTEVGVEVLSGVLIAASYWAWQL